MIPLPPGLIQRWRFDRNERALSFGAALFTLVLVGVFMLVSAGFTLKWSIDNDIFIRTEDGGWTLNQVGPGTYCSPRCMLLGAIQLYDGGFVVGRKTWRAILLATLSDAIPLKKRGSIVR